MFQNSDKSTEDLSARRAERLAARRKRSEETDFSSMDAGQLKSYIDKNLKTTFKGLNGANTDYIREAVKVIDQLEKALGGRTLDGLSVQFGGLPKGVYAKYDDKTGTLLLKKTGSLQQFEESQKAANLRYRTRWKTDKDYYATETYSGTIWHELGHAVDIASGQKWSRSLSATSILDELSVRVSAYAGSTQNVRVSKRSEAWAENFAAFMDGGKNKGRVPKGVSWKAYDIH